MEIKEVIKLLKELPEGFGLEDSDNWDGTPETEEIRKNTLKALKFAISTLGKGEVVGSLEIDGKKYKITK